MKTGVIFRKAGLMIWLLIFLSVMGHAQTILYTEDFEGASPDWSLNTTDLGSIGVQGQSNQWLINNTYTGGTWLLLGMIPISVVNTPNQPAAVTNGPTSKYLHVNYPASGIFNSCYVDNTVVLNGGVVGSNFAKMNSDINTVGQTGVTLEFYWLGDGAVGKVYYSTNGGTTWTQVGGTFAAQGTWTLASITNAAFNNQPLLRFGFLFDNSVAGTGLDPAFSIDQISVYDPSSLPVELLSFEVSCGNEDVLLEWETATETNNDHFLIERTEDMLHIETIGTIAGQGNSDRLIRYSFTDPAPLPTAYYRLKQVDFDGTYSSSKWVWCACNMSNGPWLNVFPNPADDRISIGFSGSQDEKVVVRIYDNLGREIQRTDFVPVDETCTVQFSLDGILPGIYTLVVQTAQKSTTFKIVKK
jgi:hypothetical protein